MILNLQAISTILRRNSNNPDLESKLNYLEQLEREREQNPKRRKCFFVGIDGLVLAESSKDLSDDKDSSFTKVVAITVDESSKQEIKQTKEKTKATAYKEHLRKHKYEIRKFTEEDIRCSNSTNSFENLGHREEQVVDTLNGNEIIDWTVSEKDPGMF